MSSGPLNRKSCCPMKSENGSSGLGFHWTARLPVNSQGEYEEKTLVTSQSSNQQFFCYYSMCLCVCMCVLVGIDMAAPPEMPIVIDHVALKDILGPSLFEMEVRR